MLLLKICFSRTIFKNFPKQSPDPLYHFFFGQKHIFYIYTPLKRFKIVTCRISKNT